MRKKERARKLRNVYGYSYGEIARELGVGKITAYRWLNEDKKSGKKINYMKNSLNKGNETFHPFHFALFGTIMEHLWNES